MIPGTSGNSYEIVQAPGYVAIRYERMNDVRVIPLDGRPHANIRVRAHLGDARSVSGRYADCRDDELPRPERLPRCQSRSTSLGRTIYATT